MNQKVKFLAYSCAACVNLFVVFSGSAQIPSNSFYHSRETVLPYATLSVLYPDGSQNAIPFTPVIIDHLPAGVLITRKTSIYEAAWFLQGME